MLYLTLDQSPVSSSVTLPGDIPVLTMSRSALFENAMASETAQLPHLLVVLPATASTPLIQFLKRCPHLDFQSPSPCSYHKVAVAL